MKKIWGFNDPKTRKYGLLTLLFFALGFNLSMNPKIAEHFVRNELPEMFSTELAQTSGNVIVKKTISEHEYILGSPNLKKFGSSVDSVKILLTEENGKTKVSASVSETAAKAADTCTDCLKKLNATNYSLALTDANLAAIKELVKASIEDATKGAKPVETTKVVEVVKVVEKADAKKDDKDKDKKEGEFEDADITEWAKNCAKKSEDDDLDCHKDNLAKLSKHLKNSSKQASIVKKYFDKYIKSDLQKGLRKDLLTEEYQEAYRSMGELIEELESKNGKSTVQQIYKMAAKGFDDRARQAERLRLEGFNEGNPLKFQEGLRQLSMLEPSFYSTASMLTNVTSNMDDLSNKDLEGYQSMFQTNYSTPVRNFLTQLARGCTQTSLASTTRFSGCSIPTIAVSDDDTVLPGLTGTALSRSTLLTGRTSLANRNRALVGRTGTVGSRTYVDPRYNRTATQRYNSLGQPIGTTRRSVLPFQNGTVNTRTGIIGGSPSQREGTVYGY